MASSTRIVVNDPVTGSNSYLVSRDISRLYCGYADSTSLTSGVQNQWERFPDPSTGFVQYRNIDFATVTTTPSFTYQGSATRWFRIAATCNVLKGDGAPAQTRTIELEWRKNGVAAGPVRQAQMSSDSSIVTGVGQLELAPGDVIEPWIRNVENTDTIRLFNCSFDICEDYVSTFILNQA